MSDHAHTILRLRRSASTYADHNPHKRDLYEAADALDALSADLAAAREALREVEWNGYSFVGNAPCPSCGCDKPHHFDSCKLAAVLAADGEGRA